MKILSISDLITNSSSEVFCVIKHKNAEILEKIHTDLYEIFDCWRQEYEMTPYLEQFDKDIDTQIKFEIPYGKSDYLKAYEGAIETWLKENYTDYQTKYYYDRF